MSKIKVQNAKFRNPGFAGYGDYVQLCDINIKALDYISTMCTEQDWRKQ